jgi:hypothetical protein
VHPAEWYDWIRLALYVSWVVMIGLTIKLLVVRSRWRHPFRGNGPMLWALLLLLISTEMSRARNISAGDRTPPPYLPSLLLVCVVTVLIMVWLWQQMELLPRWLREHIHLRRRRNPPRPSPADYTNEEDVQHGTRNR